MITGGVKTTPVLAMQLRCDLQPFTNIIEKNAAILFNRLIRLPQIIHSGGTMIPMEDVILRLKRALFNVFSNCSSRYSFGNYQYPLPTGGVASHLHRWLTLDFAQGAGIGVFSHLFCFYLHAGPLTTHFDGEVEAIHIALQQLAVRLPPIERAVILSDSTSALQALSNYNENNCLRVQNCRELLGKIKGKIVFQWVPSHCGLWGNERADFLAKKGTGILQNFRRDLTLHSAKLEIKRIFRESFRLTASRVARDKPWSTLCKKSHGIPSSPRAAHMPSWCNQSIFSSQRHRRSSSFHSNLGLSPFLHPRPAPLSLVSFFLFRPYRTRLFCTFVTQALPSVSTHSSSSLTGADV
ncbi:uncharacterized protein LOC103524116 [Trichonephila clavipes]|nr:uncharacterized protein LOC103524116 [Trichonephila clavipes]